MQSHAKIMVLSILAILGFCTGTVLQRALSNFINFARKQREFAKEDVESDDPDKTATTSDTASAQSSLQ
jgi:hypothetical protein